MGGGGGGGRLLCFHLLTLPPPPISPLQEAYDALPSPSNGPLGKVVFSPPPPSGTWWTPICGGLHVSSVYQNFREKVDVKLDGRARELWTDGLVEDVAIQTRNVPLGGTKYDGSDLDDAILIVAREGRRQIHNRDKMFDALTEEFPNRIIAMVAFTEKIDWVLQCALWRKFGVVVGIHGGNLGCSPFLSPGQALIEGSFECEAKEGGGGQLPKMSMFGVAATAQGAMYRCALVADCDEKVGCMDGGGTIRIDEVVKAVREVDAVQRVEQLSTWPRGG